jgi:hypothetical protein
VGLSLGLLVELARGGEPRPLTFHLTFDQKVSAGPFTGRVFVMLSRKEGVEPRHGPNWFQPEPFFARDVRDWRPGEPLVIGAEALGCPHPLHRLAKGPYTVQAVMDFDRGERHFSLAPGNGYSKTIRRELDPAATGPVTLTIDQVVAAGAFQETRQIKLVDFESKLLTAFHGRSVRLRAAVILPGSFWSDPARRYPVVYEVPGFGGTHHMAHAVARRKPTDVAGVEMLWVVLDPTCRLGHHVFANSANNGPCGRALVEELIPYIEKRYRALGVPGARFVVGHSSGGWSSLWLQVAHADFFGGCWSTAPDPVDFRDFQGVNIYEPGVNVFVDGRKQPRPLARRGGKPVLFFQAFSDMDRVMGHGGQLDSFDAVFSPRGPDGKPVPLWDRDSGAVNPAVARHWEKYDIRLVLQRHWQTLGPKLAGKLHVRVGAEDTFYLDGAVALLRESLASLGGDAVVEVIAGRDHGNLVDASRRQQMNREMAEVFKRNSGR